MVIWFGLHGAAAASTASRLQDDAVRYRDEGIELQQHGDLQSAMAMFQKASYLDPGYAAPHNDLGILYESQNRLEDAEREYQAALSLNPGYAQAHTNLALLYERQGNDDLAGRHWMQRYHLGQPDDPWTRTALQRLVALGLQPAEAPDALQSGAAMLLPPGEEVAAAAGSDADASIAVSPQQQAMNAQMDRHDVILREFEAVTDADNPIWGKRR